MVVSSPGDHNYAKECPSLLRLIFNITFRLFVVFFLRGKRISEGLTGTHCHNLGVRHPESRGRNPGITAEGYYDHVAILRFVVWRH